jgi:hypothetical protein
LLWFFWIWVSCELFARAWLTLQFSQSQPLKLLGLQAWDTVVFLRQSVPLKSSHLFASSHLVSRKQQAIQKLQSEDLRVERQRSEAQLTVWSPCPACILDLGGQGHEPSFGY